MFEWFKKRFDSRKNCSKDPTKKCPISYTWDRNGALVVDLNTFHCCKYKRQFEAAAKLGKLIRARKKKK